jgi:SAM-dependent methyltransferase
MRQPSSNEQAIAERRVRPIAGWPIAPAGTEPTDDHGMPSGVTVLQSWNEVGAAIDDLSSRGYHRHYNLLKNWDLSLIRELVEAVPRDQLAVDLGAGGLAAVRLLHEMGFRPVRGYDLGFKPKEHLIQMRDWLALTVRKHRPTGPPYRLFTRDLLRTGLPSGSVGLITCLSVIEHGVELRQFFREAGRLLRPEGRLYVSTDYWDPKIDTESRTLFGLPWTIFCSAEIEMMIELAAECELVLGSRSPGDLRCTSHPVHLGSLSYTFAALRFTKRSRG